MDYWQGGGKGFVSPLQNYWGKLLKMFREFLLFQIDIKGKCGWIIWEGVVKGLFPPSKIIGGPAVFY